MTDRRSPQKRPAVLRPAGKVAVLGSANLDVRLTVQRLPRPGETLLAGSRLRTPGGKGLNQAVAAARAGADTTFIGSVGDDLDSLDLLRALECDGISAQVTRTDSRTGVAYVLVDDKGENCIVVDPGANADFVTLTDQHIAAIAAADVLVVQLEVPLVTVTAAARLGRQHGTLVVLNAAPAQELLPELLSAVDVLLVNSGEAGVTAAPLREAGARAEQDDLEADASALMTSVATVIVTRGAQGAEVWQRGLPMLTLPAPEVPVLDTTAAGDTFAGYLAAGLAVGQPPDEASQPAVVAASLAVTRVGACESIPVRAEVAARRD